MSAPSLALERRALGPTPLVVLHEPSLPLVRLAIAFRGGAWRDPAGRAGRTRLLGELTLRGTLGRDRRAFHQALEQMGSVLGVSCAGEALVVRAVCHTRHLPRTLELLGEALATPALDAEEHAALRDELIAGLAAERDDDEAVAELFLRRALYGEHPLSRPPHGDVAGVTAVTVDELVAHRPEVLAAENAVLVVAGDVTAAAAERLCAPLLARLPAVGAPPPAPASPAAPAELTLWLVDKPERSQVQLRIATLGPAGREPEALAFAVGVTAFGGTFTSTLTREIRDRRGWSYVAHAAFDRWGLLPAPLVLRSASATTDVLDSLAVQLELFAELARGRVDAAALAFARDYLANREPLERQSVVDLMPLALRLELGGEPLARIFTAADELAALDLASVGPTMARRLAPERLAITLVGPAEELARGLAARLSAVRPRTVDFRDGLAV